MSLIDREAVLALPRNRIRNMRGEIVEETINVAYIEQLPSAQVVDKDICVPSNDCISRQAAIDTEGLDEQIRCEMCRNPMHTYRGCDGNCKYDEKLYERIIQILGERIKPLPSAQPKPTKMEDLISRGDAIEAIYRRIKQLGLEYDAGVLSIRQAVRELPSAQPTIYGYNVEHLELIARVLQKENLSPERVVEALTDIGRIIAIVTDEFEESLRKAVEQCKI